MSVAGGAAVPVLTTSQYRRVCGRRPRVLRAGDVHRRGARLLGRLDLRPLVRGLLSPPAVKEPGCSEAPKVTASASLSRSLRALRRAHWVATFPVRTNGVGRIEATLVRDAVAPGKAKHGKRQSGSGAKTVATVSLSVAGSGTHVLHLALPAAGRVAGSYSLRVRATSPDGKGHVETTFGLEIVS